MKTKLDEIVKNKFMEIKEKNKRRDFLGSIINPKQGDVPIISEIKLASPTAGKLGKEKELEKRVSLYEKSGADAISVVVDKKYFGGDLDFIKRIKSVVSLPILAKDFIIDPYQIYEMKVYGADAILLIAKIVSEEKLVQLVKLAKELNMEPVVEVQDAQELKNALKTDTRIIAVNARNLNIFKIDIDRACRLLKHIPEEYITLGFSGVQRREHIEKYRKAGAKGMLVGTSLMRTNDITGFIEELKGICSVEKFRK